MTKTGFLRLVNSPWKMALFLWWKLPSARFMGVSVLLATEDSCRVALPYRWRSQNPFRSTYFAAQCSAGELSTGVLALAQLQEAPPMSMLVTKIEAEFFKKASETLVFECVDGAGLKMAIQKAASTFEAETFVATSQGRLPGGELATTIRVTWSFKLKR